MIFNEIKKQNIIFITNCLIINNKKNTLNLIFKIKIKKNLYINNFIQINYKKNKKKIFFFPKFYILQNIKFKKNVNFLLTNIFIY